MTFTCWITPLASASSETGAVTPAGVADEGAAAAAAKPTIVASTLSATLLLGMSHQSAQTGPNLTVFSYPGSAVFLAESRSRTITWIVPATGIAASAPSTPANSAPTSTEMSTASGDSCTVRP